MQSKQKPCASIAARLHGAAVSYSTRSIFLYFSNFADGSEREGLSAFTGKFLSSTAVFRTQVVSGKKSRDNDHAITIDAKHFTVGVSSTLLFFLREINRFLETLSSFCIFEKALFLDTRDSILEHSFAQS